MNQSSASNEVKDVVNLQSNPPRLLFTIHFWTAPTVRLSFNVVNTEAEETLTVAMMFTKGVRCLRFDQTGFKSLAEHAFRLSQVAYDDRKLLMPDETHVQRKTDSFPSLWRNTESNSISLPKRLISALAGKSIWSDCLTLRNTEALAFIPLQGIMFYFKRLICWQETGWCLISESVIHKNWARYLGDI